MQSWSLPLLLLQVYLCHALAPLPAHPSPPTLHFTLQRRGGPFPCRKVVNFTLLTAELEATEARFNLTRRELNGNKVVRLAKERVGEAALMGEVGRPGNWFAKLRIGEPEQNIDLDLDMLTSDFFIFSTTSNKGSIYYDIASKQYTYSNQHHFPICASPSDIVHLPTINKSLPLTFAHCKPSKSSLSTLMRSGAMLGLAPSPSLSQTKSPTMFDQLLDQGVIERSIWSLMLINSEQGVLSVGGTSAELVEAVEQETKEELDTFGQLEKQAKEQAQTNASVILTKRAGAVKRVDDGSLADVDDPAANWEDKWRWSKVQGAQGWWQVLMQGVWVDNAKVLKNQPSIIDLNTPFILAPPAATTAFYASISGSRRLPPPLDRFHAFPCLNPPAMDFEFGGWRFPVMAGTNGNDMWREPGGVFSLGKVQAGSGYCVGAVVETRMGIGEGGPGGAGRRRGAAQGVMRMDAGNGLRDVWVLGEVFFRGIGGVFDFKEGQVGFRKY